MTGLDQERRRRVLLRAVIPLGSGPEDAQHDQHQQYRADGDMPGHQVLAHPVLTVVDAVEELEELPDDQQPHAPVEEPGYSAIALLRIIHVLLLVITSKSAAGVYPHMSSGIYTGSIKTERGNGGLHHPFRIDLLPRRRAPRSGSHQQRNQVFL